MNPLDNDYGNDEDDAIFDILSDTDSAVKDNKCVCTNDTPVTDITLDTFTQPAVTQRAVTQPVPKHEVVKSDNHFFGTAHNMFLPNVDIMQAGNSASAEDLTEAEIKHLTEHDISTDDTRGLPGNTPGNTPAYTARDEDAYIATVREYLLEDDYTEHGNYQYDEYQKKSLFVKINMNTLKAFIRKITPSNREFNAVGELRKLVDTIATLNSCLSRSIFHIIFGNRSLALRYLLRSGRVLSYVVAAIGKFDDRYTLERPVTRVLRIYSDITDMLHAHFK